MSSDDEMSQVTAEIPERLLAEIEAEVGEEGAAELIQHSLRKAVGDESMHSLREEWRVLTTEEQELEQALADVRARKADVKATLTERVQNVDLDRGNHDE